MKSILHSKWDLDFSKYLNLIKRSLLHQLCPTCHFVNNGLFDQGLSIAWNHFVNFLIPFWIRNEFWKSFVIWKWFQNFFVIWIQFWNCFQTIEEQVINYVFPCKSSMLFNEKNQKFYKKVQLNFDTFVGVWDFCTTKLCLHLYSMLFGEKNPKCYKKV